MTQPNRGGFPVALFVATAAFAVYLWTLAADLTWANYGVDGGELITAAVTLGVPHPPGYPLYVLAGKVISYLPVGSMAYRFNLFSAVTVALAAGFVTAAALHLLASGQRAAAVAAGLSFALMPLVWSQALIAEVYGLNLAFSAALAWALLAQRPTWQAGVLLGLAVTSHLTSLLLLPLALALTPYRDWFRLGLGFVLGLTPLLALPFLAQTGSPVIWGEPATFSGWWWLISGRLYHDNLFALPLPDLWTRLQTWLWLIPAQFLWVGLLFILVGLIQSRASRVLRPTYWLLATAALYTVYAAGYATEDAIVLLLPGLMLLSLLLALGLRQLGWIVLLLPLVLLLLNFNTQRLNVGHSVRPLAEAVLQVMPPDAILLTPGDPSIFTLWYFQHVEGRRPDLILVDSNLFAFAWYRQRLQRQYPDLGGFERDDLENFRQINQARRPICLATLVTGPTDYSCSMDSS